MNKETLETLSEVKYEQKQHCFTQRENILFEAQRVLLNEQLDKVINVELSNNNFLTEDILKLESKCPWKEPIVWTAEPDSNISHSLNSIDSVTCSSSSISFTESKTNISLLNPKFSQDDFRLIGIYFKRWKSKIADHRKNSQKETKKGALPEEKLNEFISHLKNMKNARPHATSSETKNIRINKQPKPVTTFKNRFVAQKNIINMQKAKLEEQKKIINELKLGIIREDLLKSIENTKIEIKEIFGNCSEKILCKAPLIKAVQEREQMMINSQKAPTNVQRMQQKASERANYRNIILERKRIIEEARQKLLEEAIEKKRALEEEERKQSLELINEQRKKELELQIIRQHKRQMFAEKLTKAVKFYNKLLVQQCFKKLFINFSKAQENYSLAKAHYLRKEKLKVFCGWLSYVERQYEIKYEIADAYFSFKTLKQYLNNWKEYKLECVRSLQVAEDLYDFRLTSNTFIYWHRYVCKQIILEDKNIQVAIQHHNRRMLFQFFYQWRSLPVVNQLEKAKENKKRKWREKVWEILPDFQPSETLEYNF